MQRLIFSFMTTAVLLALSASLQASVNPAAAQGLVGSLSDNPFITLNVDETVQMAQANKEKKKEKSDKSKSQESKAKGYEKSGNPKAAGGPQNPGKGKPNKPSDARPEQPIAGVKPEQPIEGVKPEQPVAPPQPEPRDKDGSG